MAIRGALYDNDTVSHLVKTGVGKVYGVIVNSHTNGTLRLGDATTTVDETADAATGVLTVSGAIVPAAHATNTLTSDATNVSDAETVTIGSTVYRFKDTMAQAFDVKIGADAETSLANLKKAINGTGTEGVEYFAGTTANANVVGAAITATTLQVWARVIGTTPNTLATTETSAHLSWADTTLGGGTGASDPGVAATNATVTIDGRAYTFVNELSETSGASAVLDQILWGGTTADALDNFKLAINAGAGAGTNYSTGTTAHASVNATTNTDTAQTIEADTAGVAGNSITTTETLTNGSWGAATLENGRAAGIIIMNTYTFSAGSQVLTFPEPINFVTGLYATIGGTIDYTILFN